ncbi:MULTISPECIES: FAD-dependent oxidoreductase [unclassified Nocardioides]|uniref:FAD-dependent oxidoreductase n=1 Tax=unclassified Nocardioides TaxID=2615069 RepID=UPI0006F55C17|nr:MULTISPECIES: FAD-dependent oxidoreductase [unclassified Nocardioides]KRA30851.1 hypothetical protein ASD81_15160 [Nocardioides sp. Root614]KRA87471.1 hypothetical protein ASD84_15430 [Nocardioides sp. Root682]
MSSYWLDQHRPVTAESADRFTGAAVETTDVVVVGAGLTGLTTGLLLARAGKRVIVLEAGSVGSGTTGHTTGKVSLLQGRKLSRLLEHQSKEVARAYVEANREGQAWLLRLCDEAGIRAERRTAMTYAATAGQRKQAQQEHEAAIRLGLPTEWTEEVDVPFRTFGAVALADQVQIDPVAVLAELVRQFADHGGSIIEGDRVVSVSKLGPPVVGTASGRQVHCDHVVLATGTPILDRGLYFAKLEAHRSYLLMFEGAPAPESMLISAGAPTRSLREVVDADGGSRLMVGGEDHLVGRATSEQQHVDRLREWVLSFYPGARQTHAWSAQDYRSHDGVPYVGDLPRGGGHIKVATGFDKWGLTNGVAAALRISAELLGSRPSWAVPMARRITRPSGAAAVVSVNVRAASAQAGALLQAETVRANPAPAEGSGSVGRRRLDPVPVATSTVAGRTCSVSGVCTHLGGILHWNDAEQTWDCPLHGSRFTHEGEVIEGPATRSLPSA